MNITLTTHTPTSSLPAFQQKKSVLNGRLGYEYLAVFKTYKSKSVVSFISIFIIFCSVVSAQVSTLTAWTLANHGTSSPLTSSVTVPAGTGIYRCMVVAVASNRTPAGTRTVTVTYGGQSLTSVAGDMASSTQQHTQLYYLNEAGIDAATNTTLSVTVSGGTTRITDVWYSIYDAVDQTTPIADSKNYNSGTSTTTNPVFASALTVNANNLAVEVISSHYTFSATPRTITYAANWTMGDEETSTASEGIRNAVASRTIPGSNTTDASSTTISGFGSLASMTAIALKVTPKLFRSNTATMNWGTANNWQQSTDGGVNWVTGTSAPTSADGLVTIRNGHTVTLAAVASASNLIIDAGGNLATNATAANTLTVTGSTTVAGTITFANTGTHTFSGDITITGTWNETANAVMSIAGNMTNNATSFTAGTGTHTFSGTGKSLSGSTATVIANTAITGSYTNNGTLTAGSTLSGAGSLTQGSSAVLNIGGTSTITTLTASAGGNTVSYTGAAQTLKVIAYGNLVLSGSNTKTMGAITTISEDLTLSGTVSATTGAIFAIGGNLTVGAGTTLTMGNFAFTVTGTTSVTGTMITTSGATGTRTFTGAVTTNIGGVWNLSGQNPATSFAGGITANGTTFNNGSGAAAFSATQSLAGSSDITFGGSVTPASFRTLTNNNTGTVTIAGTLTLTGNFTQGSDATLALSNNTPTSGAGTFTATASGNTVNYTGVNQTLKVVSYRNLGLSGSGTKTMGAIGTISENFTLSGSVTATTGATLSIGGNLSIGSGSTLTMASFAFTVSGTTSISGTLATSSGSAGTRTFTGAVTINSGGTWNLSGQNPATSFAGGITMSGTSFNNGSGTAAFSASQALAGSASMTFGGTVTPAASTTLTNNNTATVTLNGTLTLTGNFIQGTNTTLSLAASTPISGAGSFDASTNSNTVNYSRAGNQTVKAVNYRSLGISGGSTKTLAGSLTVSEVLSIAASTTLSFGNTPVVLTLSGTSANRLASSSNTTSIIDMSGSNAAHLFQIAASSIATFGALTTGTGSTVEYNASGAQTVFVRTYNHLKLSGSGAKTSAVTTISKNLELSGTVTLTPTAALSIGGTLTIGDGTAFTAAALALTVTGATTVGGGASGTLTISSATGTKAFNGDLIVNTGAIFNNTAANVGLTLPGSLSSSGTFNAGTGVYTLSGATKTISGNLSIPRITITGTYTNNGTLTVGTALSGSGTLTQGLNSNLSLGGTYGITGLVATANGNTITYSGSSAQNVRALAYQNLEVSNPANITLLANTDVQENVTLTNGKLNLGNFNLNITGAVLGAASASYIATTGTGRLLLIVGNSPITFPVGNSTYNPLIIANSGVNDVFGVRVIDAVTSPGVNNANLLVTRFWNVTENEAGGSNLALTAQWSTANQGTSYATGTNVKFAYHNGTAWSEVLSAQSGSNPSLTADGSFNVTGDDLTPGRTFGVGKDAGFLPNTATILVGSLADFGNQCVGSHSDEQMYTVSGMNLGANNIVVTPPTGYQISTTSGSGFSNAAINLVPVGGYVSATPVYVRFSPATAAAFNGNITHTHSVAATKTVAVTGVGGNYGPTVTSPTSSAIGSAEVNLSGNITNLGCSAPSVRGVEYTTDPAFVTGRIQVGVSGSFGTGAFTINVTGLTNSTTYYYKAYATNAQGTSYSSQGQFTTLNGARYAVASGNWSSANTWAATSGGAPGAGMPGNGQAVFIEGNRTVTINTNTNNLNSLNIDSGSTINHSGNNLNATTININGTYSRSGSGTLTATTINVNVYGTFNRASNGTVTVTNWNINEGGKYIHAVNNVVLPTATWNVNSTCEITGRAATALTGLNQSFGNFIWNCTGQSTNAQNLPDAGTMSIAGNLTINSTGSQSIILTQSSLSVVNYAQTGGTFNLCNSNNTTRTLNVSGNFSHTAGTISVSGGNAATIGSIDFTGNTIQTYTSGGTLTETNGKIRFNINADAIVDFGTSVIPNTVSGIFTNSGTMITKNTAGITISGSTGTVQSTGSRNYNGTGSYVYNGSSAQVTGNGLTLCANLTINNAAGVTLSSPVAINNAGLLSIGTVTSNTVLNDGGNQISVNGGVGAMDLTMANGSSLNIGSAGAGTTLQNTGTCDLAAGTTIAYISAVAQAVSTDFTYQQLTFSGAGTKTVNGPLTVAQNWSTTGGLASLGSSNVGVAGNITGSGSIQFTNGTLNIEGNWTNTGTLTPGTSTVTFDGAGAQVIGNGTLLSFNNLTITNDNIKTLGAAISCSGLLLVDNDMVLNTANFGVTLAGDLINSGTINSGSSVYTITGTATQSIDRFSTTGAISMTKTGGEATFANNVSGASLTLNGVGGTLSLGIANDIIISGNWTNTNGTLKGGSSTLYIGGASSSFTAGTFIGEDGWVEYNAAGTQAMAIVPYNNLTLAGTGAKTGAVTTVNGDFTLTGTATYTTGAALVVGGSLGISNGTSFTAGGYSLTVTGITTVGGGTSGTLTINSATGVKTLNDDLIINAGATFNNSANAAVTLAGGISNGGTFTTGTGVYTLGGTDKDLSGTLLIPNVTMTGSYTNNGTLTVATALAGSGSLTQETGSLLNVGGTVTLASINAGTNVNTVNFTSTSGGQSIPSFSYNKLTLSNTSGTNTLGGSVTVGGQLTLSGGKLALGSNTLIINSNITGMTSSSCFTANGASSISIGGSGTLGTSLYLDQSTPGTTNRLTNFTYNRSSQTIILGDSVEVTGTITPTAGTLATGNKLKLVSNASGTAIMAQGSGSYISGNVIAERYIPSVGRRWRFFGSPVSGTTFADLKNEIYITGGNGAVDGFDATSSNQPSVYSYDETVITGDLNSGFVAATNITNPITVGKGFRVFVRGDRSDVGRLNGTNATQNAVTMNVIGPLNTGNITMPVSFTSSGILANDGWNLIANPYASPIDWNAFHNAGRTGSFPDYSGTDYAHIDATVYIYDASSGAYTSFNAFSGAGVGSLTNGIIPSGSSFWVKAVASSPLLTMKEVYKTGSTPAAVFKTGGAQQFTIKVIENEFSSDEATFRYLEEATSGFDVYDIRKLNGSEVNIASIGTDGSYLSANYKPFKEADTIPLSLGVARSGEYKMEFHNPENMAVSEGQPVYLIDALFHKKVDVKKEMSYNFTVDKDKASTFGDKRFMLVVGDPVTGVNDFDIRNKMPRLYLYPAITNDIITVYSEGQYGNTSDVRITDVSGKTIGEFSNKEWNANKLELDFGIYPQGLYFISITGSNQEVHTLKCLRQ